MTSRAVSAGTEVGDRLQGSPTDQSNLCQLVTDENNVDRSRIEKVVKKLGSIIKYCAISTDLLFYTWGKRFRRCGPRN